jgi:hypothetical protein
MSKRQLKYKLKRMFQSNGFKIGIKTVSPKHAGSGNLIITLIEGGSKEFDTFSEKIFEEFERLGPSTYCIKPEANWIEA